MEKARNINFVRGGESLIYVWMSISAAVMTIRMLVISQANFAMRKGIQAKGSRKINRKGGFHAMV
jgi:hypothetical protein